MPLSLFSMGFYSVTHPEQSLFRAEVFIFVIAYHSQVNRKQKLESIYKSCGRKQGTEGLY
jgi:hypothetical protein